MQIQCPKCGGWTNSEKDSCSRCGETLKTPPASPNSSKTEAPIDLNQLYSTGQRDKAESIINTQQDRAVILNGMLTTGREILKRRKIAKNILYIIFIIIILIALATLWFIFKAELPYYQNNSTDTSNEVPR